MLHTPDIMDNNSCKVSRLTVALFCRSRAISRMISAFFISSSCTSRRLFFSSFLSEL